MDQIFGDLIRGIVTSVQVAASNGEKIKALQIAESYLANANDYVRRELLLHLKNTDDAIDSVKKTFEEHTAPQTPPVISDDKIKKQSK